MMEHSVCRQSVVVTLPDGLHLRPISQIARLARQSACEVRIFKGDQGIDAKNMIEAMTLNAPHGTTLVLEASGEDARAVVAQLARLFETNFEDGGEGAA